MLTRLLSNDLPRSRVLAGILLLLLLALAFTPFLFPGVKALNVGAKVLVFVVLVASFDLLLGYTGIVSFAHTMFFGIGAYGVAIAATRMGAGWSSILVGTLSALALSFVLAGAIRLFSLRVRASFFSMTARMSWGAARRRRALPANSSRSFSKSTRLRSTVKPCPWCSPAAAARIASLTMRCSSRSPSVTSAVSRRSCSFR